MNDGGSAAAGPSYAANNTKNFEDTNPFRNVTYSSHNGSFGKASICSNLRYFP